MHTVLYQQIIYVLQNQISNEMSQQHISLLDDVLIPLMFLLLNYIINFNTSLL